MRLTWNEIRPRGQVRPRTGGRRDHKQELGFGLGVSPNAIAALRRLRVADFVLARGFTPTRGELRRMDGTVVKRAEVPPAEALGGPLLPHTGQGAAQAIVDAVTLGQVLREGANVADALKAYERGRRNTCSPAQAEPPR